MKLSPKIWAVTLLLSIGSSCAQAQDINQAATYYNSFAQHMNNGSEASAYIALYQSYEVYMKILSSSAPTSLEYGQAKVALKNMFPYLEKAAYYYSARNDQARTLQYAQAHVGVSVLPAMQNEGLQRSPNYTILAKLAASAAWRSQDYEKAIPMLSAYLSTGDTDMRREVYNNLGIAYYKTKNYTQGTLVLEEGLRQYPNDLNMHMALIEICKKSNNESVLQTYLPKAIALLPANDQRMPTLLNMQGDLQENHNQYEDAVITYSKLRRLMPNDLNTARHLALSCYNAGVQQLRLQQESTSKKLQKQYREKANMYFLQAEPVLNDVMANDPLAVKYAFALATVYSSLGEERKLEAMNQKMNALGYKSVDNDTQMVPPLIAINNPVPIPSIDPSPPSPGPVPTPDPQPTPVPTSDVDINIPETKFVNSDTYAVVIANEVYKNVPHVKMAHNDGLVFAEYCRKVLGLPEENIRQNYDVTSIGMQSAIEDIKNIATIKKGDLNIIFYYAGHGNHNERTKDAYLLPVDANALNTIGCLSLKQLYSDLEALGANSVVGFLDACFSGSLRGEGMLMKARAVADEAKVEAPKGNMVIFSATQGNETAFPYKEKEHGLFTYYLLQKMQQTKGNVTLGELESFLKEKVALQAQVVNKKPQTPTVTASAEMGNQWQNMKLINKKKK